MSYTIKAEDIPEDMHDICDGQLWPKDIAAVINAAIDAGLVSPLCWAMRNCNGELVTHQRVFTSREAAEDGLRYRCTAEHWKGQTE